MYIEVIDDGKGLDKEKIILRAKEMGIINEKDSLTDKEVFNLIFRPGFSTSSVVTDTSGRGVGMDVVKQNINALHGKIDVISEKNKGTKFIICLPLTAAIIESMIIKVDDEKYFIPLFSIKEIIRPFKKDIVTIAGKGKVIFHRGELLSIFYLSDLLGADEKKNTENFIVIIAEDENKKIGFIVDEILGQQQIVVKSLNGAMGKVKCITGCTITNEGRVGLILDIPELIKLATEGR